MAGPPRDRQIQVAETAGDPQVTGGRIMGPTHHPMLQLQPFCFPGCQAAGMVQISVSSNPFTPNLRLSAPRINLGLVAEVLILRLSRGMLAVCSHENFETIELQGD